MTTSNLELSALKTERFTAGKMVSGTGTKKDDADSIRQDIEKLDSHKLPKWIVYSVLALCALPVLSNLMGFNYAIEAYSHPHTHVSVNNHLSFASYAEKIAGLQVDENGNVGKFVDHMFYGLKGAFWHMILEWSAISVAFISAGLAFAHYRVQKNFVVPFIGVALLCAGIMDAYHTASASRITEAIAPNNQLIPFTWAEARLFNAISLIFGTLLLLTTHLKENKHIPVLLGTAVILIVASLTIIGITSNSETLPQSMFKDALFARPYDIVPMIMYAILGGVLLPLLYRREPSIFSAALILSMVPQVLAQFYMAFDSSALFDNGFIVGHSLKILAYLVPCVGIVIDYVVIARRSRLMEQSLDLLHQDIVSKVGQSVCGLSEVAEKVSQRAEKVSKASVAIEKLITKQSDCTSQSAAAMEEMTVSVQDVSKNAQQVVEETHQANKTALSGSEAVSSTINSMEEVAKTVKSASANIETLSKNSEEIGQVISVINTIADQTNLLALNAAIEAARAGEHGRGFSVVADEVRALAGKTQGATKDISDTIGVSQTETEFSVGRMRETICQVDEGAKLAEQAKVTMANMVGSFEQVSDMITQIATANEQQSSVASNIAEQLVVINEISSELVNNISQITQSAAELTQLADTTRDLSNSLDISCEI